MKKFFRCLAIATLLTQSQIAFSAEKLTVLLDWFVNPDHGPLIVAQQRGMFEAAGLEVELIAPADPNDPPKLVAAGKAAGGNPPEQCRRA